MSERVRLFLLAGGSGTRFWPKSTSKRPKQLLAFGDDPRPLMQRAIDRLDQLVPAGSRWVLTTGALAPQIKKEISGIQVLAEPMGRNTAPCIYWAARRVAEEDSSSVMLVLPSDSYVADEASYQKAISKAVDWASEHDDLVTFGITPSRPETGYGYLRSGAPIENGVLKVEKFVEKPDLAKAQKFLKEGGYFWNGGMFAFRAEVILREFDRHIPDYKKTWDKHSGSVEKAYPELAATSIDYAVMEKASNVVMVELDCGWDDLGNWISLEERKSDLGAEHAAGAVTAGEVVAIDSSGNIVDAPGKLVALLGVHDLVVVEKDGAILVASKDQCQEIRKLVEQVKAVRPDLV